VSIADTVTRMIEATPPLDTYRTTSRGR